VEAAAVMAPLTTAVTESEGACRRIKEGEEEGAQQLSSRLGAGGGRRSGMAWEVGGGPTRRGGVRKPVAAVARGRRRGQGGRVGLAGPKG
jgi:hypothetical protein